MAELGVFDEERKEWIQFDEDAEVLIEFIPREELKEVSKKAEKLARKSGVDISEIQTPILGKRAVKGWRKIDDHKHPGFTIKGQPFPFSEENVVMLLKRSYEFFNFVHEYATNARFFLEAEKERAAKNSGRSPVPSGEAEASR